MKILNFGCGKDIKKDFINVDIQESENIDVSFDFNKFPYPFKDNTFDYIFSSNVLEHLDNPQKVLKELHRISKENSIIHFKVPYFRCEGAFADITHKHFFNRKTIRTLINKSPYLIKKENNFEIIKNKRTTGNRLKYIPRFIRYFLDYFLWNFYDEIEVKLKVKKSEK
ncbi:MAG: class I SAM-dependent methyltransferase [Promethearchaeota archaeon]